MTELLHNPNSRKNIPRKRSPKPERQVSLESLDDLTSNNKASDNKIKKQNGKTVDQVTFDTTLRMNNHLKNFLKAMVILGSSPTQQEALQHLQKSYFETLSESEQKTMQIQIDTLEHTDVLNKNN
uniref:DUF5388 domain-containing protein n=1 Tax=Lentilactobacillus hilgardii TaxID=1588 RepID=UPI00403F95CD